MLPHPYIIPGVKRPKKAKPQEVMPLIFDILLEMHDMGLMMMQFKSSKREYSYVRFKFWYLIADLFWNPNKKLLPMKGREQNPTLRELGEFFGKDHTTVIHAIDTYKGWIKSNSLMPPKLDETQSIAEDYLITKKLVLQWIENQRLIL